MSESRIAERIAAVRDKIRSAELRSGRKEGAVTLVAVTKTRTPEEVARVVHSGLKHLGENRVQEFMKKRDALSETDVRWHIIGPLQTNKVKYLKDGNVFLQSLDRLSLAEEVIRRVGEMDVLVQVNISGEPQKSGVSPENLERFLSDLVPYSGLHVKGLMCIAEHTDVAVVRRQFEQMRLLFEQTERFGFPGYEAKHLSMGMSSDYEAAISEGSNMVRIGTEIFGRRV